jgi:DNA-directed RNA polymerase beta' subunit
MQIKEVFQLQEAWKKKGNPPCKHAVVDRDLGSHTGDLVCTTCGSYVDDEEKPRKRRRIVIPR